MHQEEFSSMSSYLIDIQFMALKVIPFHPRLIKLWVMKITNFFAVFVFDRHM